MLPTLNKICNTINKFIDDKIIIPELYDKLIKMREADLYFEVNYKN